MKVIPNSIALVRFKKYHELRDPYHSNDVWRVIRIEECWRHRERAYGDHGELVPVCGVCPGKIMIKREKDGRADSHDPICYGTSERFLLVPVKD